jgi:hypothetical protein
LIAFIGYVNNLNKLQQFKVSVQKSHHNFNALFISAPLLNKRAQMTSGELTRTTVKRAEKCIEVDGGIFEHLPHQPLKPVLTQLR